MKNKGTKSKKKFEFPKSSGIPGLFGGGKMSSKKEPEIEIEVKKKK